MNDLEICTRIADIEGVAIEHIHGTDVFIVDNDEALKTGNDEYMDYNPLTDDALCFKLMVKYGVTFDFYTDDNQGKVYYGWVDNAGIDVEIKDCTKLNVFICLAIIEANK